MPFRDDILRGVRLFLIVFAAILVCVAGYRYLRTPLEAHGADAPPPQVEAAPPDSASSGDSAADPAADSATETHPAVVVPPPPEIKAPASHVTHARTYDVPAPPPPAPVTRARRAPAPSGREFESAEPLVLPAAAPVVRAEEPAPTSPKQQVGYKSLLEVNADRLPADPTASAPASDPEQKPKNNRFIKALGKIFHPGKQDQ